MAAASLLCSLIGHRAEPGGRWNHGYCFSRCGRCGRDMVKSLFGEWHVPKGLRVAWHDDDRGAVAALDAMMQAREVPDPPRTVREPAPREWMDEPEAPTRAPVRRPAPQSAAPRPGSPFDFGEFDAVDPTREARDPGSTAARSRARG